MSRESLDELEEIEKKNIMLLEAAANGHVDRVTDLVRTKVEVEVPVDDEAEAISISFGLYDYADLNHQDEDGRTALHFASANGRIEVVQELLKLGADASLVDKKGLMPLDSAQRGGHSGIALLLQEWDARPPEPKILEATRSGNLQALLKLVTRAEDINTIWNEDKRTPLHISCEKGRVDIAKLLLENSSIPNAQDIAGITPLFEASMNGYLAVVELLLQYGADVNLADNTGSTPLKIATARKHTSIAMKLLHHGGDPFHADHIGDTPLDFARIYHLHDLVEAMEAMIPSSTTRK